MKQMLKKLFAGMIIGSILTTGIVLAEETNNAGWEISDGYEVTDNDLFAYTVYSAPAYLFDSEYYYAKYEDLQKAFGNNPEKLYNHWNTYGKKEGRSPSPVYDPDFYLNNNSDLKAAFGKNYAALYEHFVTYGINEFRKSAPIYDGGFYKSHYADLQKAFGNNSVSYINHFMQYGMKEGRQASSDFNVNDYKDRYKDLRNAFGNNLKSYFYHYMEYGINEKRNGSSTGKYTPGEVKESVTNNNNSGNGSQTGWVKTSGSNLNMRSAPRTSSSVVCKIPNKSQITVYGNQTRGFYKISYNGKTGYASGAYITFSQPDNSNTSSGSLIDRNLSRIKTIKQGSKTCKATAVAQSLNIIVGSNKYTTSAMGNSNCKSINGNTYIGSDGNRYKATYKTDSYTGSSSEQMSAINSAVSAGLPIVVAVHSTKAGKTKHHWVTIIGKSGSTYRIIDPASGSVTTMSACSYSFGLADYSSRHYGYVSFTRQ